MRRAAWGRWVGWWPRSGWEPCCCWPGVGATTGPGSAARARPAGWGPSASGTGSGSGLAGQDLSGTTNDQQVLKAVADYKTWVVAEVDGLVADTSKFTDAVRAGDVAEAKKQFAPSRVRWERIEPIAGLVEEIDGKVDARVDDFEGVTDPEFTGWHRLEYHLGARLDQGHQDLRRRPGQGHRHLDQQIGTRVPAGGGRPGPGRAGRGGLRGGRS